MLGTLFFVSLLIILMEAIGTEQSLKLACDQAACGLLADTLPSRVDRNFRVLPPTFRLLSAKDKNKVLNLYGGSLTLTLHVSRKDL